MAQIIEIRDSLGHNGAVTGTFRLVRGPLDIDGAKRDKIVVVVPVEPPAPGQEAHKPFGLHVYEKDITITKERPNVDKKAMLAAIQERFYVMSLLTEGTISRNIRSFIMAGSAGIGKSFNLMNRMQRAVDELEINEYSVITGRLSGPSLYQELYNHKNEGDVLILDDVDVFSDERSLDILKGALDTTRRPVTWGVKADWLEKEGIPSSFDFNGTVVFISNQNFDRLAASNGRLAPHIKALISRSIYLDLLIHDPLEIMIWVDHVVRTSDMRQRLNLSDEVIEEILTWMWDNYDNMRELSLRTPEHIASFTRCHGDWRLIANNTMIRK